jgi:F-type H+-transporting ATPase subunit c
MIESGTTAILSVKAMASLGAAFVMGIGTIGPALGQGMVASAACKVIGQNPESKSKVQTAMVIGLGMIESVALFAFLVAMALIFAT